MSDENVQGEETKVDDLAVPVELPPAGPSIEEEKPKVEESAAPAEEPTVTPPADPPPPPAEESPAKPEHPIGSAELAIANGVGEVAAAAYANYFRKLRQEGSSEEEAHEEAAKKSSGDLVFRAKSVLRNEETVVMPGEKVDHLSGPELVDLLSRDAVEVV